MKSNKESVDKIIPYRKEKELRDEKIRRLYNIEGYSIKQISKMEGHSHTTVLNAIHNKVDNKN